jgi:peroxiredoxin Q/BCP
MTASLMAMVFGAVALKAGDKAPDFTLPEADGQPVTLSKLLEKGPVILAFYPKAFTPGCTKELTAYRDRHGEVAIKGAQVLAISTDDVETLKKFKASLKASYPFLSDKDGAVSAQYSGKNMVGMAHRATFVIDRDRTVKSVTEGGDAIDPSTAIKDCPFATKKS